MNQFTLSESTYGLFMEAKAVPSVLTTLKPEILKISKSSKNIQSDIVKLISDYFNHIPFSLERDEWNHMNKSDKANFAKAVITRFHLPA